MDTVAAERVPPANEAYELLVDRLLDAFPDADPVQAQVTGAMHILAMALFVALDDPSDQEAVRDRLQHEMNETLLPVMAHMAREVSAYAKQIGRPC